jgi:hypothetical protein
MAAALMVGVVSHTQSREPFGAKITALWAWGSQIWHANYSRGHFGDPELLWSRTGASFGFLSNFRESQFVLSDFSSNKILVQKTHMSAPVELCDGFCAIPMDDDRIVIVSNPGRNNEASLMLLNYSTMSMSPPVYVGYLGGGFPPLRISKKTIAFVRRDNHEFTVLNIDNGTVDLYGSLKGIVPYIFRDRTNEIVGLNTNNNTFLLVSRDLSSLVDLPWTSRNILVSYDRIHDRVFFLRESIIPRFSMGYHNFTSQSFTLLRRNVIAGHHGLIVI